MSRQASQIGVLSVPVETRSPTVTAASHRQEEPDEQAALGEDHQQDADQRVRPERLDQLERVEPRRPIAMTDSGTGTCRG
jgi:hypothetical protein